MSSKWIAVLQNVFITIINQLFLTVWTMSPVVFSWNYFCSVILLLCVVTWRSCLKAARFLDVVLLCCFYVDVRQTLMILVTKRVTSLGLAAENVRFSLCKILHSSSIDGGIIWNQIYPSHRWLVRSKSKKWTGFSVHLLSNIVLSLFTVWLMMIKGGALNMVL